MTLRGLALRVELEQLVGHVLHRLADARLGLLHCCVPKVVQDRLGAFRRAIFLDQIEARQRNIEPRASAYSSSMNSALPSPWLISFNP
jgi:hypothetical protein